VSPYFDNIYNLITAIKNSEKKSNASADALNNLARGRFGSLDGHAIKRAAAIIDKIKPGKFTYCWPLAERDYSCVKAKRHPNGFVTPVACGICGRTFAVLTDDYLKELKVFIQSRLKPEYQNQPLLPQRDICCPFCGTRVMERKQE